MLFYCRNTWASQQEVNLPQDISELVCSGSFIITIAKTRKTIRYFCDRVYIHNDAHNKQ